MAVVPSVRSGPQIRVITELFKNSGVPITNLFLIVMGKHFFMSNMLSLSPSGTSWGFCLVIGLEGKRGVGVGPEDNQ